jgi:hypothetical protein
MARDSSGGGALGWTLLGFLAGVAATLGLQILMSGQRPTHEEATSSAPPAAVAVVSSERPKPVKKAALAVSSAAPVAPLAAQPTDEVADDAAAAGMTSRITPANEPAADDKSSTASN